MIILVLIDNSSLKFDNAKSSFLENTKTILDNIKFVNDTQVDHQVVSDIM
ncbi:hypothetical protein [Wolbachia endosymbiont of Chironomus riparius]|nr:hypothetical protein [Wolbachia endosymbiont of Chironomus riparius]